MAFDAGTIIANMKLNTKDFSKGMDTASKDTEKGQKNIDKSLTKSEGRFSKFAGNVKKNLGSIVIGFGAVGAAATNASKKWVDAYATQEAAENKLTTLVKKASQDQIKSLQNQASALQKVGVVGDEVTMVGQAQLGTFALQADTIETLTGGMLDMAVAQKGVNVTQEDMINFGNLVGKAMQGQIGALSRVGISFSDAQADMLKTGNEMERAATLAEVIEGNFGGMNETLAQTTEGGVAQMKNAMGDLNEVLGSGIAQVLKPLTSFLQVVAEKFQNMPEPLKKMIGIGTALIGVLSLMAVVLAPIAILVNAIAAPVWLVIGAIAGMIAIFLLLKKAWDSNLFGIQDITKSFFESIGDVLKMFADFWKNTWDVMISILVTTWDLITGIIQTGFNFLRAIFLFFMDVLTGNWSSAWGKITSVLTVAWDLIKSAFSVMGEFFAKWGGEIWDILVGSFGGAFGKVISILSSSFDSIKAMFTASINWMIDKVNALIKAINKVTGVVGIPNIPSIPALANGGIVTSPTLAMIGEGGESEAVIPLSKLGGMLDGNGGAAPVFNFVFEGAVTDEEAAVSLMNKAWSSSQFSDMR